MCDVAVIEFFIEHCRIDEFNGKRVLEVGSRYINGSVRPFVERFLKPREYIGIDIEPGKFVDLLLPAEKIVEYFGEMSFDVIISTELLEHVRDWRLVINNMKKVVREGGYIYITTRSIGFPYHGYPYDFWRYEIDDMKKIFSDFNIIALKRDPQQGILLKAKKPKDWRAANLDNIALYSILLGRRTKKIVKIEDLPLSRRIMLRFLSSKVRWLLPGILNTYLTKAFLT